MDRGEVRGIPLDEPHYLEQQNSKGSKGMVPDRKYTPLVACSLLDKERNTAWFHVHAL